VKQAALTTEEKQQILIENGRRPLEAAGVKVSYETCRKEQPMRLSRRRSHRLQFTLAGLLVAAGVSLAGQSRKPVSPVPRTADGRPDLQNT
jgi:hypothetical protein